MDKYVYDKDELLIGNIQCDLCEHQSAENNEQCKKSIPITTDILKGQVRCSGFSMRGRTIQL